MSRYIDADKLHDDLTKIRINLMQEGADITPIWQALDCVRQQPSADVVEVVRCKDCVHYNEYDNVEKIIDDEEVHDGWCMRWSGIEDVNRHDYCSYGEKEEYD